MAGNGPRPLGVAILAILQILTGIVYLVGGGVLSAALAILGTGFASLLGGIFVIIGIIEIIIGLALFTGKSWARILVLIGAIIDLIGFPIGTIFGIILLVYFTRPKVVAYFK